MKTSLLNQLSKEITQGQWILKSHQQTGMALIEDSKGGDIAICDEGFPQHNAHAISLTPQLIREVLELRKALCDVDYYLTSSGQGWINASNEGREAWKQVRAIVSKF